MYAFHIISHHHSRISHLPIPSIQLIIMGTCKSRNVKRSISKHSKLLIFVIGGPCSGKSSVTQFLSSHFQLIPIFPDRLIRECADRHAINKPDVRLERLQRRRVRTQNAILMHNKMTREEKEVFGENGEPAGVSVSYNHFSLLPQSDSEDELAHLPPVIRDIQLAVMHGVPIDPSCIAALIFSSMHYSRRNGNGFVIDGYPRNLDQYEALCQMVGNPHMVVRLNCSDQEMMSRALARAQAAQRCDDNEPFLNMKIQAFNRNFDRLTLFLRDSKIPILDVDGTQSLEQVKKESEMLVQTKISGHFRIKRTSIWNKLNVNN